MTDILELLHNLGRWSIEGLWIPVLVWTTLGLPVYALTHSAERISPHVRQLAVTALLVALPAGLAVAALALLAPSTAARTAFITLPTLVVGAEAAPREALEWTPVHTAGLAVVLAAVLAVVRLGYLGIAHIRLCRFRRELTSEPPAWLLESAAELAGDSGVSVTIRVSDTPSPFTFGLVSPVIVIPRTLLRRREYARIALTHEFIHVHRRDYAVQWIEQIIGAVFFIHPLVTLLRRETSVLREITCDAEVIARTGCRTTYARLLYEYSEAQSSTQHLAVGIFTRKHQLTKRIRAMKTFLDRHGIDTSKRRGIAVFALLLMVAVAIVACSEAFVDTPSTAGSGETDENVYVVVEEMPQLKGGLASIQDDLQYPELARKAGIEGRVIVQFVVDEEGRVVEPKIVRGLGSGLDESALDAVRRASFVPGRQRGQAVPVKMSLPVTFKLGSSPAPSTESTSSSGDVHTMPELIGGLESIRQRLRYPASARDAGVEGRVILEFTVDEQGRVADLAVVRGLGSGLDEAAIAAARSARFTPGTVNGEAVPTKLSLPVSFRLP